MACLCICSRCKFFSSFVHQYFYCFCSQLFWERGCNQFHCCCTLVGLLPLQLLQLLNFFTVQRSFFSCLYLPSLICLQARMDVTSGLVFLPKTMLLYVEENSYSVFILDSFIFFWQLPGQPHFGLQFALNFWVASCTQYFQLFMWMLLLLHSSQTKFCGP